MPRSLHELHQERGPLARPPRGFDFCQQAGEATIRPLVFSHSQPAIGSAVKGAPPLGTAYRGDGAVTDGRESATMNGTRCCIRPLIKCTSRPSRSSLATTTGQPLSTLRYCKNYKTLQTEYFVVQPGIKVAVITNT